MSVAAGGYRQLATERVGGWNTSWAIARWNLRSLIRQKLFWALVALGLLHFLVHYVLIYIKAQISIESPAFGKFIDNYQVTGTGAAYRVFLDGQARAVLILLAYAGVTMVASDFRAGGIAFYLSKPMSRFEYVLGKAMALWVIIALLTVVPATVLFLEYGFFTSSTDYWMKNSKIIWGILGYSALIMLAPSLVLLAVGAVCRRGAPLIMVWCSIFLVLPAFGALLRQVFNNRDWLLINFWRNLSIFGEYCFGARDIFEDRHARWAAFLTFATMVAAGFVLRRRLRAVEVIE